jgi:hypothetical protein
MFVHDKMKYECEDCGYSTTRKLNFTRHRNRKNSCNKTVNGDNTISNRNVWVEQNIVTDEENIVINLENIVYNKENIVNNKENIVNNRNKHKCKKCNKSFCNKASLLYHEKNCKGVDSLTCPICLIKFENSDKKYRHKKKGTCKPPAPSSITNNTINNNTNYVSNNSHNTNCNNQNVQINVFGNEDMSYLLKDKGIVHRLRMYGKEGLYGLPKILDDVHFNKDRPENHTIIKPEEYGNIVLIKNSNNEWEFREFEDIRENMIDTIIKYFRAYNEVKKSMNIDLVEEKEKNFIKKISYELMALEGYIPRDLFYELEMDENKVEENEDAVKNKTRKFDKSTMHMIHNRTYYTYKKENGQYVKK